MIRESSWRLGGTWNDQATKRGGCALAPIEELDPGVVVAGSWDSIESRYLMLARGTLITRTTTAPILNVIWMRPGS